MHEQFQPWDPVVRTHQHARLKNSPESRDRKTRNFERKRDGIVANAIFRPGNRVTARRSVSIHRKRCLRRRRFFFANRISLFRKRPIFLHPRWTVDYRRISRPVPLREPAQYIVEDIINTVRIPLRPGNAKEGPSESGSDEIKEDSNCIMERATTQNIKFIRKRRFKKKTCFEPYSKTRTRAFIRVRSVFKYYNYYFCSFFFNEFETSSIIHKTSNSSEINTRDPITTETKKKKRKGKSNITGGLSFHKPRRRGRKSFQKKHDIRQSIFHLRYLFFYLFSSSLELFL